MASASDWRSESAADALARMDRADFAAEFLRRNARYRDDYARLGRRIAAGAVNEIAARVDLAHRWGLRFPARPEHTPGASPARPVESGTCPDCGHPCRCPR